MKKSIFTVSPNSLPKKKREITAGASEIGSSTPRITVERVDKLKSTKPKSVIGKEKTNNPITDKTLNKARAKGIDKDTLIKLQHESDLEDLNRELGKYDRTKKKQLAKGNLDMGVAEVDDSADNSNSHKQMLMSRYGVSDKEFDNKYNEYAEKLKTSNADRARKENEEFAKNHPVLGTIKSIGLNLLSPAEGIANNIAAKQTGLDELIGKDDTRHINPNNDFIIRDSVNSLRSGAKSNIKADTEMGKKALDFAYDIGTSAGDMAAQALITGGSPFSMGLMQGGSTANDMLKNSLDNGNSQLQASIEGTLGGALGGLMASKGLNLAKNAKSYSTLGRIGAGALSEGGEELAESVLDEGINRAVSKIAGGKSNKDVAINEYMADGMTEEQAQDEYKKQRALNNALSFLGGAGFGATFGGLSELKANRINSGKTNTAVLDMLNGNSTENNHANNILNGQVNYRNVPIVNNSNVDISNLGKPPKNRVPNLNKVYGKLEYNVPTFDSNIKWGRNPESTLRKLLADNTISVDEKEKILGDYSNFRKTNRPITEEEFRTVIADNKISPETKEQLINSMNNGDNMPKAIALYLYNKSNVNSTRHNATPYDNELKYDDTYNVINEALAKVPGIVRPGTNINKKLGVYDNLAIQKSEAPINYNENLNELEDVVNQINRQTNKSINKTEIQNSNKTAIKENFVNPLNTNTEQNIRDVAQDGLIKGKSVDKTSELGNQLVETNGTKAPTNFLNQNNEANYDAQIGDSNVRERGVSKNIDLPDDFKAELNDRFYKQLSNKSTKEKAYYILDNTKDIWEAKNKFDTMLNNQEAASVVLGYELSKKFIDEGRPDVAADIVERIASAGTRAGQFNQATSIIALHNDPMAVLALMQKEIKKINDAGKKKFNKWNDISLTDEEITALNNAGGDTKALQDVTDSIYSRIAKDYPHTFWEYFYDTTKTLMLFNPRTHLRNVVANAITMPVRSATDRVKAAMEIGYNLINKDYKRTSTLTGGDKKTDAMASQVWENVKDRLDNLSGKYEEGGLSRVQRESQLYKDNKVIGEATKKATQYSAQKTADVLSALDRITGGYLNKKTGIVDTMRNFAENDITGSNMENLRQFNYLLLGEIEDTPFVKQNFINSLSNYIKAQKITDVDSIPQDAINLAYDEALKATFKDDNFLTEFLSGLKHSKFNKTTKLFDIAMPYTKTPANLAMRALEYSPAGFAKSFKSMANMKEADGGTLTNTDISRFIGDLSKNVTGTAMIYLGYALAKAGIITGSYSDNQNERNWQKLKGFLPNAFHIGGKYYTYDWAQPSSIPLLIGTSIYEGMQTQEKEEATELEAVLNSAKSLGKGLINAGDAWFNLSPMQNLADIMGGGDNYGDNSIVTNVLKTIAEYPQTLLPSALGATARANDTTIRNTYDKTSYANTYLNQMKAKIPKLSETLPASYDVWGRERKRGTDEEAAFSQFINPGNFGYYNSADKDIDDYVDSIYNAVKDNEDFRETQVYPRQAAYSVTIDGKEKALNNKEYSLRQKTLGTTQRGLVRAFSKIANESGLTLEEQATALNKIYKAANDGTNVKLYGLNTSLGKTEAEMYNKGAKEYVNYVKDYILADRLGLSYDSYIKKIKEGGEQAVEEYVTDRQSVDNINAELGTDINVETYQKYKDRLPSLTNEDVKTVETLKRDYDTSTRANTLSALANLDVTDEERSRYIKMLYSDKELDREYINRGIEKLGEENLYKILLYKALSDDYGKNFVNDNFETKEERELWNYILKGK